MLHNVRACVFVITASILLTGSAHAAPSLSLDVGPKAVIVKGATPGGTVIVFGVGREPHLYYSAVRRWMETLSDSDHDGVVTLTSDVTQKSIWVAVDLETGNYTSETGQDYPRREIAAGDAFKKNNVGQLTKIEQSRGRAEMLIVRAREGAWHLSAEKNAPADEAAGTPQPMRLRASSFQPVVGSRSLTHLERGDVVAMIDPGRMEFFLLTVKED